MIFPAAHSADRHGSRASRGEPVDEDHGSRGIGGDAKRPELARGGSRRGRGFFGELFRLLLGLRVLGRRVGFLGLLGLLGGLRLAGLFGLFGLLRFLLLVRGHLGFAKFLLFQQLGLAVRLRLRLGLLGLRLGFLGLLGLGGAALFLFFALFDFFFAHQFFIQDH